MDDKIYLPPPFCPSLLPSPSAHYSRYYYVDLLEIQYGNQRLPLPAGTFSLRADGSGGGVIFDSGSSFTYLPRAVVQLLLEKVRCRRINGMGAQ